jgi:hypothetical protein
MTPDEIDRFLADMRRGDLIRTLSALAQRGLDGESEMAAVALRFDLAEMDGDVPVRERLQ